MRYTPKRMRTHKEPTPFYYTGSKRTKQRKRGSLKEDVKDLVPITSEKQLPPDYFS